MRYSLVLWDFDGTLAETLPGVLRIFNELAAELGFTPVVDVQAVRDKTPRQFFREQGISLWRLPALRRAIVARQKDKMAGVRLYPGITEVLEQIGSSGCRMGIVSSNAEENIRNLFASQRSGGVVRVHRRLPAAVREATRPAANSPANWPAAPRGALRGGRRTRRGCRSPRGHRRCGGDMGNQHLPLARPILANPVD